MRGITQGRSSSVERESESLPTPQESVDLRKSSPQIGPGGRPTLVAPKKITKSELAGMCEEFAKNRRKMTGDAPIDSAFVDKRDELVKKIDKLLSRKNEIVSRNDGPIRDRSVNELAYIKQMISKAKATRGVICYEARINELTARLDAVKPMSPAKKAGELKQRVMAAVPGWKTNNVIERLVSDLDYVAACGETAGDVDLHTAMNHVPNIVIALGREYTTELLGTDLMKEFHTIRQAPISIKDIPSYEQASWWADRFFGSEYDVSIAEDRKSLTATWKCVDSEPIR